MARGCEAQDGVPPGATIQCTFDPPKPKLEMAMRPPFQGVASVTTCQEHVAQSARVVTAKSVPWSLYKALASTVLLRAGCHRSESKVFSDSAAGTDSVMRANAHSGESSAPGGSLLSGCRCWGWGCCSAGSLG